MACSIPPEVFPGIVSMDERRYAMLAELAGEWLSEFRDVPCQVGESSGWEQSAIYVVVNGAGLACYAGQTAPPSLVAGAAHHRIKVHLSEPAKRAEWQSYWVIPLKPDVPSWVLDALERNVCSRLGLPVVNNRWRKRSRRSAAASGQIRSSAFLGGGC